MMRARMEWREGLLGAHFDVFILFYFVIKV